MNLSYAAILTAHVLAAAAWFGAMFYSFSVLHPRAKVYFRDVGRFEDFIAFIAAGARYKVLGGAAFIAVSGIVLLLYREDAATLWWLIMAGKTVLLSIALFIFAYASWWLWPERLFASAEEIPGLQRKFATVAVSLIVIVTLCFALSVLAAHGLQ